MSIVLVGGMDRLGDKYQKEAKHLGMNLHIFSQAQQAMGKKIKHADAVVIFTNKVSHQARHDAFNAAKKQGIPVFMHHSCGVCSLRECLNCMINGRSMILDPTTPEAYRQKCKHIEWFGEVRHEKTVPTTDIALPDYGRRCGRQDKAR